ncbi:helix-turn-helix domain-containing protein [Curtobacterium sp. ISL-83]|uniref:helix-turn-helix domain-containing protein n=1 Tax=Curtobacterium sp. ISL-83 TaxID=2819145 RepID=UPI002035A2C6|nr:helix-turn-helix domain-containing protein [Curtobacterium sp. ISL-83]
MLLDSTHLPRGERNDALSALISEASGPTRVTHSVPDEQINSATQFWALGPSHGLIRTSGSGMRLTRTPQELRSEGRPLFALSFQHRGTSTYIQRDGVITHAAGELYLENVARPYEYAGDSDVDNASFLISHNDLGLSVPAAMEAGRRMRTSPLYRLMQGHMARLTDIAAQLPEGDQAAELLAASTLQLTRALLASTDREDPRARDAVHDTQYDTLLAYVRQHIRDPSLDARRIARDNHVSIRQLYKIWARSDLNLHEWILRERLDHARAELAAPASVNVTIEVVARRWGFSDPSHFSRRFRAAYGVSPREWRMAQVESHRPGEPPRDDDRGSAR